MSKSILIIFQCLAFKLYSSVRYFTCKNTFCILSICLLLHFQMCKNYAQHRNCTSYCLKRNDKTQLVNAMNINMPTSVYFNFNILLLDTTSQFHNVTFIISPLPLLPKSHFFLHNLPRQFFLSLTDEKSSCEEIYSITIVINSISVFQIT